VVVGNATPRGAARSDGQVQLSPAYLAHLKLVYWQVVDARKPVLRADQRLCTGQANVDAGDIHSRNRTSAGQGRTSSVPGVAEWRGDVEGVGEPGIRNASAAVERLNRVQTTTPGQDRPALRGWWNTLLPRDVATVIWAFESGG
jgi:hypothetical protein